MGINKYTRLQTDCDNALRQDNLEKYFELLRQGFNLSTEIQKDLNLLEGNWNRAKRFYGSGQLPYGNYSQEIARIANALGGILEKLGEDDISTTDGIHDRILIVACRDREDNFWTDLFPEAYFSHRQIIRYRDEVPDDYKNTDVVIFDDLGCKGDSTVRENFIRQIARELPNANLLYFGKKNPFQDSDTDGDDAIFDRMANANSRFTIHARLRELLEYRKVYSISMTKI